VAAAPGDVTGEDRLGGSNVWTVIGASAVGTVIEWYDSYTFRILALVIVGAVLLTVLLRRGREVSPQPAD
jgi:hypothetical protein